jgi:2-polyprenyl-3-methyl-5-hydroxy-6-metoxy-1,4-benzoquinol methylase
MENTGVSKDSQEVKSFFDGYASDFDSIYGHTDKRGAIDKLADKWFRKVMVLRFEETLKRSVNPSINSVIDIGCGPGLYCVEFLKQGKEVMAIDLAENMLSIAKGHVEKHAADKKDKISYLHANYLEHNFDVKYDAACLMGLFDYIKDPVELFEKLKKDINKEVYASFPKDGGFLAWQRKVRYNMRNCPLYLYTLEDIKSIMHKVGLDGKYEVVDCERGYFVKVDVS